MYKIYCIIDNTNDNVYIGQTKNELCKRISCHKSHYKTGRGYCSSSIIFKNNDWTYKLLEDDLDPYEAKLKEAFYIQNTENCINQLTLKYGRGKGDPEKYKKWVNQTRIKKNEREKNRKIYKKSWGTYDHNLLSIDVDLFKN
tara:strand:- start:4565 stop:4990 length:426 start_codon:yes stop_codon:yes gene_type:complete